MEVPKTLTLTIPSEPRNFADLMSNTNCPVARAVRKLLPEGNISVGGSNVWLDYENTRYIYNVPGMGDWLSQAVNSDNPTPEVTLTLNLGETWQK